MEQSVQASAASHILFLVLEYHRKSWGLVGGAPRAWATGLEEPGDLDVVVGGTMEDVDAVVRAWVSRVPASATVERTKLGGYRLTSSSDVIDLWAAPATVAIARERVRDSKRYRAVAKSAALSLDSLVLTSEGTLYDFGFFRTLRTGTLELNHTHIERKERIVAKAQHLCRTYGLTPDLTLQGMIAEEREKRACHSSQLALQF